MQTNPFILWTVILMTCFLSVPISGQTGRASFSGTVTTLPSEGETASLPAAGAVILVVTAMSDSLFTTVSSNGKFRMIGIPVGKAYVCIKLMGYKDEGQTMNMKAGENKISASLKPTSYTLDETVVKESVSPVSVEEDTIIFKAAAAKINKGEMAVDILEQMPGVEISDSGVNVLNEEVSTVYVDGVMLFGNNPMRTLNNLPAEEVASIKSFQEYANKDPYHKISKNETKQRVLDVKTKSRPKFVVNGNILASGGFDTDSTYQKFRYATGITAGAFSEKLQVNVNANANNINNGSNNRRGNSFMSASAGGSPDFRSISFSVSVNRKWMSPSVRNFVLGSVGGRYTFSDQYNVNESITQLVYFPSEQYQSRQEDRASRSYSAGKAHNFSVNGNKSLKDGHITTNASFKLSDDITDSQSSSYNTQDNLARQGTTTSNSGDRQAKSFNLGFGVNKRFNNKFGFRLNASGSGSSNESDNLKTDSTTTTISHKEIIMDGNGTSRNFSISPSVSWEIDDYRTISAGYSYSNSYSKSERWAYDISDPLTDPLLDSVNTYVRLVDNNSHSAHVNYRNHFEKMKANLSVNLGYSSTGMNRHETVPVEDLYIQRFNSFNPSASLGTESMLNKWSVSYSSSGNSPSMNQVRPKINNNNLYNVSAGNPDLKQSRSHKINLSYSTVLGAEMRQTVKEMEAEEGRRKAPQNVKSLSTFSVSANFSMTDNPIIGQKFYFTEETYLPEYQYTMPAQSTFNTYVNGPDSYNAGTSARFDIPIEKIQWTLNTSLGVNWDDSPSYVNYKLTRTTNLRPNFRLGMRSNFSRVIRLNINGSASYTYSHNDEKDNTSYFSERINLGWELNNILKHIYAGGNYNKSFTQGLAYEKIDDNIFNIQVGAKFGPRNNIDFSAAVHDLFNKTKGFSTSMNSNYTSYRWTHNFGRYIMFSLAYRFNSMRKGSQGKKTNK